MRKRIQLTAHTHKWIEIADSTSTTAILLTGGIGDTICLEGTMTPEEREQLDTIYYACPAWRTISELFRALPNFPRLRHHVALPTGAKVYYEKEGVERDHGPLPEPVEDWSILKQFPLRRPYLGSSLLIYRLAERRPIEGDYVVIVAASVGFGGWDDRDFSVVDWQVCCDFLERHKLLGVILGLDSGPAPAHARLVDLRRQTSILESIEILKGAKGFLSIDSCLSVLAAKLFPANRISIKSINAHIYQWQDTYYAPRLTCPFVQTKLEAPSWN